MSAGDVTFGATSPSVCSLTKDRIPPKAVACLRFLEGRLWGEAVEKRVR
jgi:hypothetical protein